MSSGPTRSTTPEIIEQEKATYRAALPPPDANWPASVQILYRQALSRLFEEKITAKDIVEDSGFGDNNVYIRFRHEVGRGIKEFS